MDDRTLIAAMAMQGLLANSKQNWAGDPSGTAAEAIQCANEILRRLPSASTAPAKAKLPEVDVDKLVCDAVVMFSEQYDAHYADSSGKVLHIVDEVVRFAVESALGGGK